MRIWGPQAPNLILTSLEDADCDGRHRLPGVGIFVMRITVGFRRSRYSSKNDVSAHG